MAERFNREKKLEDQNISTCVLCHRHRLVVRLWREGGFRSGGRRSAGGEDRGGGDVR